MSSRAKPGLVIGVAIVVASIAIGWWQYEVGLREGFAEIEKSFRSADATADPQTISRTADHAIYAILAGAVGVVIGVVIVICSLRASRRKEANLQ